MQRASLILGSRNCPLHPVCETQQALIPNHGDPDEATTACRASVLHFRQRRPHESKERCALFLPVDQPRRLSSADRYFRYGKFTRLLFLAGLRPTVYHVYATAGYVRRAHIRCCDLWYILKPDGEEQLDCFWSCLKRTNEPMHDAAFARAGLPTSDSQKLQQQQQAQDFIAQRSACSSSTPTRQEANNLI